MHILYSDPGTDAEFWAVHPEPPLLMARLEHHAGPGGKNTLVVHGWPYERHADADAVDRLQAIVRELNAELAECGIAPDDATGFLFDADCPPPPASFLAEAHEFIAP